MKKDDKPAVIKPEIIRPAKPGGLGRALNSEGATDSTASDEPGGIIPVEVQRLDPGPKGPPKKGGGT